MIIDEFHPLVLNVGKAEHNADWNWSEVCSPFARLYYVCNGNASITLDGEQYQLRPGYLYLIPPFTTHHTSCQGIFIHYYVHIYEDGKINEQSLFDELGFPVELPALPGDEALVARLASINPQMLLPASNPKSYDDNHTLMHSIAINKSRSLSLKMESRGIVYQLFSRFLDHARQKAEHHDKRINDSLHFIRTHLSSRISVEELALNACLSPDHFIRLFRQAVGTTPLQYINVKRIEKAQLLLLSDNMSVKKLAYTLGYEDTSYFIRVFRRITGLTPTAFLDLHCKSQDIAQADAER